MSKRDKAFFHNLSGFASGLDAAIANNKTQPPPRSKADRSIDDHGDRLEKQAAKLARRAARAKK